MNTKQPTFLALPVPDLALPELQCMAVIAFVMDTFLKPRENLEDAFAQLRVAEWVGCKYGVKPEHLQ